MAAKRTHPTASWPEAASRRTLDRQAHFDRHGRSFSVPSCCHLVSLQAGPCTEYYAPRIAGPASPHPAKGTKALDTWHLALVVIGQHWDFCPCRHFLMQTPEHACETAVSMSAADHSVLHPPCYPIYEFRHDWTSPPRRADGL